MTLGYPTSDVLLELKGQTLRLALTAWVRTLWVPYSFIALKILPLLKIQQSRTIQSWVENPTLQPSLRHTLRAYLLTVSKSFFRGRPWTLASARERGKRKERCGREEQREMRHLCGWKCCCVKLLPCITVCNVCGLCRLTGRCRWQDTRGSCRGSNSGSTSPSVTMTCSLVRTSCWAATPAALCRARLWDTLYHQVTTCCRTLSTTDTVSLTLTTL